LKWIEECGHVPHLEQPQETASTIVSFLTSEKVAAAAAAAKSIRRKATNNDKDNGAAMPTYISGAGFLGAISGAYLLEEAIKSFL